MLKKTVEIEKKMTGGYTAYYLVTRYYLLGLLIYSVSERKE